ncbi:hypothetical protein Tco_1317592 [Tanacetum coccineum]
MQSSSSDSSNDILKSISSLLRKLTVRSHESVASDVNVSLKTIVGNSVSTDPSSWIRRIGLCSFVVSGEVKARIRRIFLDGYDVLRQWSFDSSKSWIRRIGLE